MAHVSCTEANSTHSTHTHTTHDFLLAHACSTAIWPTEAKCASADFVHDGALQACAEMIRGGTTCANDMYFFPNETAKVSEWVHGWWCWDRVANDP